MNEDNVVFVSTFTDFPLTKSAPPRSVSAALAIALTSSVVTPTNCSTASAWLIVVVGACVELVEEGVVDDDVDEVVDDELVVEEVELRTVVVVVVLKGTVAAVARVVVVDCGAEVVEVTEGVVVDVVGGTVVEVEVVEVVVDVVEVVVVVVVVPPPSDEAHPYSMAYALEYVTSASLVYVPPHEESDPDEEKNDNEPGLKFATANFPFGKNAMSIG